MASKMRAWLTENKVFFETLAAGMLSIMALILSLESVRESSLQRRIMQAETLPLITASSDLIRDPESGVFTDQVVVVENSGGPLRGFSHQQYSFLVIEVAPGYQNDRKIILPISGYFSASFSTNNPKGTLVKYIGNNNNNHFGDIYHAVVQMSSRRNDLFATVDMVHLFVMRYADILGDSHEEFVRLDGQR